jgi:hypothetical protein
MPCVRKLNNTAVTTIIVIPLIAIVSPNVSLLLSEGAESEDNFIFPDRTNERAPSINEAELIDEFEEEEPFPLLFFRLVFLGITRYILMI